MSSSRASSIYSHKSASNPSSMFRNTGLVNTGSMYTPSSTNSVPSTSRLPLHMRSTASFDSPKKLSYAVGEPVYYAKGSEKGAPRIGLFTVRRRRFTQGPFQKWWEYTLANEYNKKEDEWIHEMYLLPAPGEKWGRPSEAQSETAEPNEYLEGTMKMQLHRLMELFKNGMDSLKTLEAQLEGCESTSSDDA